jgi:branched-chain amino acid aminotransferase
MSNPRYLCLNNRVVPFDEARVHVLTPAFKYGATVFEGLRGYWNAEREQMFLFRVTEHLDRLQAGMRVMRFAVAFSNARLNQSLLELIQANGFRETVHIRLLAYIDGDGEIGASGPVGMAIAAHVRPPSQQGEAGIKLGVSSWRRMADSSMPPRLKSTANYVNSRIAALEARQNGYDNALILNGNGKVSEAPTACFFMVRQGRLVTPSVTSDILESITRATIIELARDQLGLQVDQREIDRTELYDCDEAFICGTGPEIIPVTHVDRLPVGAGQPGPTTRQIQQLYFAVVAGKVGTYTSWLTPVYAKA